MHEQFGRYILLDRIAIGGMAEIFKAKAPGLGGFEKVLAIKRLHPRYSQDADFIEMLIDEARITVELAHSNIGQIFDLGKVDDHYFIAMEYIDGRDLYRALKRLRERRMQFPLDAAAYVAMEACAGLDYAHRKRDGRGRPLNIIHRDVSPQNVLLSMEGDVKIVDFGIAKAALRAYETESGIIKGKFYYMSPEQARGEHLDHRTDIFSLGIVLYEMLTGDLLYKDDDEVTLLSKVRRADIEPPSAMRPDLPTSLERIVMRALSRDREDRYPSAQHMQRDLARYLRDAGAVFNKARLGQLMRELYVEAMDASIDADHRIRNRDDFGADARSVISVAHFHTPEPTAVDDSLNEPSVELDPSLVESISSELVELAPDDIELIDDDSLLEYGEPAFGAAPAPYDPLAGLGGEDDFVEEEPTLAFDRNRARPQVSVRHEPRPRGGQPNPLPFAERPTPVPRQVPTPTPEPVLRPRGATPRMVQRMPADPEEATFNRQPTVIVPEAAAQRPAPAPVPRRSRARGAMPPPMPTPAEPRRNRTARREKTRKGGLVISRERMLQAAIIIAVVIIAGVLTSWIIDDDPPPLTPGTGEVVKLQTPQTTPERVAVGAPKSDRASGNHTLHITSQPSKAEVVVDGRTIYTPTPMDLDVPYGKRVSITVKLPGYEPYERTMTITRDTPPDMEVVLSRKMGTVQVDTRPSNAEVTINNTPAGRSPVTVPRIPLEGAVVIGARADGYRPQTVTRRFDGRTELSVVLELEPLPVVAPTTSAPIARRPAPSARRVSRPAPATRRPVRRPRRTPRTPRYAEEYDDRPARRPRRRDPEPEARSEAPGKVSVVARPWGSVFINGRLITKETPLYRKQLPAGRYTVKVCFEGNPDNCRSKRVTINGREEKLKFFR
jgi:serine/threonine protein kinase